MPAHNAARFLAEAVTSVLKQTWPHWELLILDDASQDDTLALAQAFAAQDTRIKVMPLTRHGSPSKVRNHGLKNTTGDFVAFLDSDDCYLPDALANLLAGFEQNPNATAVYGIADLMDEHGHLTEQGLRLVPDPKTGQRVYPSFYSHDWVFLLEGGLSCMLPGLMLKKETLARVGLLEEAFVAAEDYQYYMRLFLDNHAGVINLPIYVYQYRVYQGSLTKSVDRAQEIVNSVLDVMKWVFNHPAMPPQYQYLRPSCLAHCYRYLIRERVLNNQPKLAKHMIMLALNDPEVPKALWAKHCLPLLCRAMLPHAINQQLLRYRETKRQQQEVKRRLATPR
jgi:glycosyltransferase involved in cell wall biosynthesis